MPGKTKIEWATDTWNPVTGCSKVSPGCAHCYAESLAMGKLKGHRGYPGLPWTPENAAKNVVLHDDRLDQPLRWTRPRMVFVNSMSDLFHEAIPFSFVVEVFAVMAAAERHVFQVLTKRPERMRELLRTTEFIEGVEDRYEDHADSIFSAPMPWPLPNVWLGTSIENRRFVGRADLLRETPAAVRFISAEPLLGPLLRGAGGYRSIDRLDDLRCVPGPGGGTAMVARISESRERWADGYPGPELDLLGIDWLIVGGESGPKHRRMDLQWVRDLRDDCAACRTAFFFKQHGGRTPKAGGRELDGRTWDEMPEALR